jgi:Ca-activated chloride channel family protein
MAEDGDALRAVYSEIDKLEKSEIESIRYMDYTERFTPFALTGLILLALEILLRTTYFRRIP